MKKGNITPRRIDIRVLTGTNKSKQRLDKIN